MKTSVAFRAHYLIICNFPANNFELYKKLYGRKGQVSARGVFEIIRLKKIYRKMLYGETAL